MEKSFSDHSISVSLHNILCRVLSSVAFAFMFSGYYLIAQNAENEKGHIIPSYDFGALDLNGEKRFSVTFQPKEFGSDSMIYEYESSCECLRLLTELPIISKGKEPITVDFSYKPFQAGYANVGVIFSFSESVSEKIALQVSGIVFDKQDLVDAKYLLSEESEKYILVDLRNKQDYEKLHAIGSIRMDVLALQSKSQWKDYQLVLLGYGLSDDTLLALAAELKSIGFKKVKVLQDGINGWIYAGGSINGSEYYRMHAAMISSFDVQAALNTEDWVPVFIGDFSPSEKDDFEREGIQIKITPNNVNAKDDLRKGLKQIPSEKHLLFISENGDDYADLEFLIPDEIKSKVTFLEGGINAWRRQGEVSKSVNLFPTTITLQSANRGVTRAGPCGSCGKK